VTAVRHLRRVARLEQLVADACGDVGELLLVLPARHQLPRQISHSLRQPAPVLIWWPVENLVGEHHRRPVPVLASAHTRSSAALHGKVAFA
jgi:hypothetical protein